MYSENIEKSCLANSVCQMRGKACSVLCPWFREISYQIGLSGIPARYIGTRFDEIAQSREVVFPGVLADGPLDLRDYVNVFRERMPKRGLFFTSPTAGNGKTEMACAIAQEFIVHRTRNQCPSSIQTCVTFVNTMSYFDLVWAGMSDDDAKREASKVEERVHNSEIVILDDIGVEKPSEFVQSRFYSIVNSLWSNGTLLIVTSNRDLDGIEMTLGPRIRSRLDEMCLVCRFTGHDRRRINR